MTKTISQMERLSPHSVHLAEPHPVLLRLDLRKFSIPPFTLLGLMDNPVEIRMEVTAVEKGVVAVSFLLVNRTNQPGPPPDAGRRQKLQLALLQYLGK